MEFSRNLRTYAIVVAAVATLVALVYWASRPAGVHLDRAEVLVQYGEGYARPPSTIDSARIAGTWHAVHMPYAPRPEILPSRPADLSVTPTQTTWYRFRLPAGARLPAEAYLYVPRWKSDGELAIYVNGRLHYQSHANLQWNGSNLPLWIAFDDTADAAPPREIVFRLCHVRGIGGALSSLWVGGYGAVRPAYMVRNFFQAELPYLSSAAFLATGFFALFVWMKRRRETLYLLFFSMSVVTFLRCMQSYLGIDRMPISDAWFGWITVNSAMWMIVNVHLFLVRVHNHRQPVLSGALIGMALFFGLLTLPLFSGGVDATLAAPMMYPAMYLMGTVMSASGAYWSWRARSVEGLALGVWGLITMQLGLHDMLLQNNLVDIERLFLSVYPQIATTIAFCHILLRRYNDAIAQVERSNLMLAERLAEREAELRTSHEKLRAIERRELIFEERQRLMQDMHDGLGSSLVTALRVVEHGRIDAHEIAQILRGCIDDLKLTIDSMEPTETDLLLLLGTLRFRLQPRLESSGIRLRWKVGDTPPLEWLDQRHTLHILRIMQEAFTNVIKHAGASTITVTTQVIGGSIVIGVTDDGCGFDLAADSVGRGLSNQRRRAEVIGGQVKVEPGSRGGTTFRLFIPIAKDTPAKRALPHK